MAVVTIARQAGACGDIIAARVASKLGYYLVDSALITRVAEYAGAGVIQGMRPGDKNVSRAVEWLMSATTLQAGKKSSEIDSHLSSDRYIEYLRKAVLNMADSGNMTIVGRGGQFILRDRENAFHALIVADMNTRIEWMKKNHGVSEREAEDRIRRSDSMRRDFISRYFRETWDDPSAYHAVLNTSKLGMDEAVEMVVEMVKRFSAGREYVPGVRDRRRSRDRRQSDRRIGERRNIVSVWTIRNVEQALLREGRPIRSLSRPDRRQSDRRQHVRRAEEIPRI